MKVRLTPWLCLGVGLYTAFSAEEGVMGFLGATLVLFAFWSWETGGFKTWD